MVVFMGSMHTCLYCRYALYELLCICQDYGEDDQDNEKSRDLRAQNS